jgi:hypothetical protein
MLCASKRDGTLNVVMRKAEYGHNAGNELRRVRHYLSAHSEKCDGNDCTACVCKVVMIND